MMHIDIGVSENCKNPDSYGVICVGCNECGRFNNESLPTEEDDVLKISTNTGRKRANERT